MYFVGRNLQPCHLHISKFWAQSVGRIWGEYLEASNLPDLSTLAQNRITSPATEHFCSQWKMIVNKNLLLPVSWSPGNILPGACHDAPSKKNTCFFPSNRAATYWHSRTRNLSNTKFLTTPQRTPHWTKKKNSKITHMNPHEIRMNPHLKPHPPSQTLPWQSTRIPKNALQQHCSNRIEDENLILHMGFLPGLGWDFGTCCRPSSWCQFWGWGQSFTPPHTQGICLNFNSW